MRAIVLLLAAVMLGLTGGYTWSQWSQPSAAAFKEPKMVSAKPGQTSHDVEQTIYYASCDDARAAGKTPLYAGQPGYRSELDPDGTGLACAPVGGQG